ncbi:MAG: NAD kinase, partial [Candidatus Accumulibacter sp.]|nr:NAD kinase [Accumulibacter sp.]
MNHAFPQESPDSANLPKTIALIGKYHSQEIAESVRLLAKYLHERGMTVLIEEETARNVVAQLDVRSWASGSFSWLGAHADMAIVVG